MEDEGNETLILVWVGKEGLSEKVTSVLRPGWLRMNFSGGGNKCKGPEVGLSLDCRMSSVVLTQGTVNLERVPGPDHVGPHRPQRTWSLF